MTQDKGDVKDAQPIEDAEEKQPLSPEQELATLRQRTQELEAKASKSETEAKAHQQAAFKASRERDDALRERVTPADLDEIRDTQKILAALISKGGGSSDFEEMGQEKKQDLLKEFEQLSARTQFKRQAETLKKVVSDYQVRTEALGLTEKDDAYQEIRDLVTTGATNPRILKMADKKLAELEALKESESSPEKEKPVKEAKKETQEEHDKRIAEGAVRAELEKRGLLEAEGGEPSAPRGGLTEAQIEKMSPDERYERRKEIAKMPLSLGKKTK